MHTQNSEVSKTDFTILQGQLGSGSGTGYVPQFTNEHEFWLSHHWSGQGGIANSVGTLTLNAVNNYYAFPFILNSTTTVNRLAVRIQSTSAPNLSITGGVMQYDTTTGFPTQTASVISFVANASQTLTDTGSGVNFVSGAFTVFTFTSAVTLAANTWYAAGVFVPSFTSGSVIIYTNTTNAVSSIKRFPCNLSRTGAGAQAQTAGKGGLALGFFDGTSYNYSIGEYVPGASVNITINATPTTQTQVGAKFEINLPLDEIYLNKILLTQSGINTSQSVVCKIYPDASGTTAIATSIVISTSNIFTSSTIRNRFYYFSPPIRLKGYRTYYAMWEVTNGIATTVNPSQIGRIFTGITTSNQYFGFDSTNLMFYRASTTDTSFTQSIGYYAPITLFFDYFKKTPRPSIST